MKSAPQSVDKPSARKNKSFWPRFFQKARGSRAESSSPVAAGEIPLHQELGGLGNPRSGYLFRQTEALM